jgi:hypothetical protein
MRLGSNYTWTKENKKHILQKTTSKTTKTIITCEPKNNNTITIHYTTRQNAIEIALQTHLHENNITYERWTQTNMRQLAQQAQKQLIQSQSKQLHTNNTNAQKSKHLHMYPHLLPTLTHTWATHRLYNKTHETRRRTST